MLKYETAAEAAKNLGGVTCFQHHFYDALGRATFAKLHRPVALPLPLAHGFLAVLFQWRQQIADDAARAGLDFELFE